MTTRTRGFAFVAVVLAALFALGLCACGGSAGGDTFKGYTARDASSLEQIKDAAIELGKQRQEAVPSDRTDSTMNTLARDAFAEANELYRAGKYGEATKAYEAIIAENPTHLGANVNLTLSMLQEEKGDEALKQALACVYLFPGNDGVLLNAQVAAADAEFDSYEIEETVVSILEEAGYDKGIDSILNSGDMNDSYTYNKLWMNVETGLADAEHKESSELESVYQAITQRLNELLDAGTRNSEDTEALLAYVEAVGAQLGIAGQ